MSKFERDLSIAIEHGEKMNAEGFKHGKVMSLHDLAHKIILDDITEVSEVLKIITEMQVQIKLGHAMTSEQYEKEAKADHLTSEQFPNV